MPRPVTRSDRTWQALDVGGVQRRFTLTGSGDGLIVCLHGGLGEPERMSRETGLDEPAAAAGFAVAYPEGIGRTWNAGRCCGPALRGRIDDVGFVSALIRSVVASGPVDPKRICLTGLSNGGQLAYRFAIERPNEVRAIAPVAASIVCGGAAPAGVALMHIHGTADRHLRYLGGVGDRALQPITSPPIVDRWRLAAGSAAEAVTERIGSVVVPTWSGPNPVVLATLEGGGHG